MLPIKQASIYLSIKKSSLTAWGEMVLAFDANAKSIIYVRCLNGFLSKNRLKEVSCLRSQKSACKALFLKLLGQREGWWAGRVQTVISSSHFIALTKQCANHSRPLSFPLFSVNMKGLVPTVTSNVAAAGPIPGHGVSLSPSPPHIKPQLTKAALGGIMRRSAPFNYVWSVTFSLFLCHVLTLRPVSEELAGPSRRAPPSSLPPWTLATEGWIKALQVPQVNSQGCVNTQLTQRDEERFGVEPPVCSFLRIIVSS